MMILLLLFSSPARRCPPHTRAHGALLPHTRRRAARCQRRRRPRGIGTRRRPHPTARRSADGAPPPRSTCRKSATAVTNWGEPAVWKQMRLKHGCETWGGKQVSSGGNGCVQNECRMSAEWATNENRCHLGETGVRRMRMGNEWTEKEKWLWYTHETRWFPMSATHSSPACAVIPRGSASSPAFFPGPPMLYEKR